MIKRFKTWLIHILGGMTEEECENYCQADVLASELCAHNRAQNAYKLVRSKMQELHGKPGDEYISELWDFVNSKIL